MTVLTGKGIFIHKLKDCEGGDPVAQAEAAHAAGLTHILLKILDGPWSYNQRSSYVAGRQVWVDDIILPAVKAFQARGIAVWGWQYTYLVGPVQEADAAIERVRALALTGFVIDGEAEWKTAGESRIQQYLSRLRAGLNVPIGFSSYRYPGYHPMPWKTIAQYVDVMLPQVYWEQAANPDAQLKRCLQEYADKKIVGWTKELVPTGSAYNRGAWSATPAQIKLFLDTAQKHNLKAANFWDWAYARRLGLWETIATYPWSAGTVPPPAPTLEQRVERLEAAARAHGWGL